MPGWSALAPWLILGTAHNSRTFLGMREILTWLAEPGECGGEIRVAGGANCPG